MLDLNRAANRQLNPDRPEVIRATVLYEFQAAVFLQRNTVGASLANTVP